MSDHSLMMPRFRDHGTVRDAEWLKQARRRIPDPQDPALSIYPLVF